MLSFFFPKKKNMKDHSEALHVIKKYGDDALSVLEGRIKKNAHNRRNQKHWQRIYNIVLDLDDQDK